ncbi:MAG: hypothetical protein CO029_03890 [Candidatus Magasanikbacteria bacterium CG_4_9_14_0_2_um_filter_41_10]|uniref:Uncharacterized protein n=1 Tax=Candidatus Magasanikbacteria bacterium CG_4_10_14_0_2_um_filter_41_31 TaxID=1974639 RepID=A0A2M7V4F0_9BACT|nr:MAG: hypothetical protein AUJ37_00925 [Candidatus Magasanikbacteria bacterium CG1_02_41_34]PIZ93405.1 MAG: hypothetical protein COX83_02010 [Candidatus Magasanikbacteria bacterium CG_4_10_14_0_2_um_filter_41_31]PJC53206.1 MAG: hypothetical protein CO029_03890 [Candidatus Magasanikbacteria bacterium CG_4_9_14_0_2_um_filter_41_10]
MSEKHHTIDIYPGDPNAFDSHIFHSLNECGSVSAEVVAQTILNKISQEQRTEISGMSEKALANIIQDAISKRIPKFADSSYKSTFISYAQALREQIDSIQQINE